MSKVREVTKASNITVFLFGKPAWEMNLENQDVDDDMVQALENLGNELKERLHYLSGLTRKLLDNGWTGVSMTSHTIRIRHSRKLRGN